MCRHVFISLLACLNIACSLAQQYAFVNYSTKEGLINNRIHLIYQGKLGKLFFATSDGLSVYDGSRFTNYNTDNGLSASLVNDIIEITEDSVLIVPNDHKLQCLVDGKIKDIETADNFYPVINQLIRISRDTFYGLGDEGLFLFSKNKFTKINLPIPQHTSNAGKNLYHATLFDQNLFINTDIRTPIYPGPSSFFIYNIKTGQLIRNDNLPAITYSVKTPENDIMVSTVKGIFLISKDALKKGRIELEKPSGNYFIPTGISANYLYFDRQNTLWATTTREIIKVTPNNGYKVLNELNGLFSNEYTTIFQDSENTMWFGNGQLGVTKLVYQNIEFYPQLKGGFNTSDVITDPTSDSIFFYNINSNRILILNNNEFKSRYALEKAPFTSMVIRNGEVYVSKNWSIYKLVFLPSHNYGFKLIYKDSTVRGNFSCLILDKAGNVIGIKNKIVVLLKNLKPITLPLEYLADHAVLTKDDVLWIITRSRKLYQYKIHPFNPDHFIELIHVYYKELGEMHPLASPRSIAVDEKSNIWIGTRNHGVYCYSFNQSGLHLRKQITLSDGLTENFVQNLFCDALNNIWVCSRSGLDKITFHNDHFNIENLTRFSNWDLNVMKIQEDRKGTIWGLTTSGILKIYPESNLSTEYIPKVYFTRFNAGAKEISIKQKENSLPYSENNLKFQIAAPSFIDEKQTRFSYKLEGTAKTSWSDPSEKADLNFVGLSPGSYSLRVKALFLNGKYKPQEAEYSFIIKPPWWQTWWFRSIEILGAILLIVFVVQSYYKNKFRQQRSSMEKQQAIEKERTRIATDMHDDLGSGLTKIAILSEVAKRQIDDKEKAVIQMDKISDSSRELANNLQDIIWILNPGNDSLESLSSYIREYTLKFFDNTNVIPAFDYPNQIPDIILSEEIRRTIFLIVKETLNNSVKYSASQTIFIKLLLQGNGFQIIIEDQGKGFDINKVREFANGLTNMKLRMKRINGSFEISTSLNKGTKTILNVPV